MAEDVRNPFRDMAGKLETNGVKHADDPYFGGALVICPPGDQVPPIELLVLDRASNPAIFLATAITLIQAAIQGMEDSQKQGWPR